jgi:hypothetical protein
MPGTDSKLGSAVDKSTGGGGRLTQSFDILAVLGIPRPIPFCKVKIGC